MNVVTLAPPWPLTWWRRAWATAAAMESVLRGCSPAASRADDDARLLALDERLRRDIGASPQHDPQAPFAATRQRWFDAGGF